MSGRTFGAAIGRLIYERRKGLGLTQTRLAADAYGSAANVRRISELENGTVARPHPKTLDPIIAILQISSIEVERCAREANFQPDADLDRAYREANQLIETVARQFEHSKPNSSLDELNDFLQAKAREWADLQERMAAIETTDRAVSKLSSLAVEALSNAEFKRADALLSEAEELHQTEKTLTEVRKQSKIRIARADILLFHGDNKGALHHYSSAAEFLRPFDEAEMIFLLERLAERIYEIGRRSLQTAYFAAAALLQMAATAQLAANSIEHQGRLNFRLGLVCRRAHDVGETSPNSDYLNLAIAYSRTSLRYALREADHYKVASAKGGLANCLIDEAKRQKNLEILEEAISLLRQVQEALKDDKPMELLATAGNNLGGAILARHEIQETEPDSESLSEALEAFSAAASAAEKLPSLELWGAAKANCGAALALKARLKDLNPDDVNFLRIQSVSAYLAAVESYPSTLFPLDFAAAHLGLAKVSYDRSIGLDDELAELNMFRAVGSFEAACTVYSEDRNPLRWAEAQLYMGSIFGRHAEFDSGRTAKHDLEQAKTRFENAKRVFEEHGSASEISYCKKALARVKGRLKRLSN